MTDRFDVVVLGACPAGEVAVGVLARACLRCALVERELIGGECTNWACIQTKTLLRPPEAQHASARVAGVAKPGLDWERIAAYRDWMTRNLDDANAIADYEDQGITVVKGVGRLARPGGVDGRSQRSARGRGGASSRGRAGRRRAAAAHGGHRPGDNRARAGCGRNPDRERCRVLPRAWAIGNVTGVALFTHVGKYQARIAAADILGRPVQADFPQFPTLSEALPERGASIAGVGGASPRRYQTRRIA